MTASIDIRVRNYIRNILSIRYIVLRTFGVNVNILFRINVRYSFLSMLEEL